MSGITRRVSGGTLIRRRSRGRAGGTRTTWPTTRKRTISAGILAAVSGDGFIVGVDAVVSRAKPRRVGRRRAAFRLLSASSGDSSSARNYRIPAGISRAAYRSPIDCRRDVVAGRSIAETAGRPIPLSSGIASVQVRVWGKAMTLFRTEHSNYSSRQIQRNARLPETRTVHRVFTKRLIYNLRKQHRVQICTKYTRTRMNSARPRKSADFPRTIYSAFANGVPRETPLARQSRKRDTLQYRGISIVPSSLTVRVRFTRTFQRA